MTTHGELILVPRESARGIQEAKASRGTLFLARDSVNSLLGVAGWTDGDVKYLPRGRGSPSHAIWNARLSDEGNWYRARRALHKEYPILLRRVEILPRALFNSTLLAPPYPRDAEGAFVVTRAEGTAPENEWAAWRVTDRGVAPMLIEVVPSEDTDPLQGLAAHWRPIDDLARAHVMVVGLGSIGSAAAQALAMFGLGRLTLIDDDRLRWRNLARHQNSSRELGMYKVDSMAQAIRTRWPGTSVEPHRLNVIYDANMVRPMIDECSLVLCAADGVAPRRVVSHVCRLAVKPSVLVCVLLDGLVGELLRLRPWSNRGCLLCQRADLVREGAMDPEPALDADYGTGTAERPMTAVGSDLVLMGQLAAKLSVDTILESKGHFAERVVDDHAVVGLHRDLAAPAPFDLAAGQVHWRPVGPPRPGCPTCEAE
jgi:molybdopterin-synthase adenylyltransferase